MAEDECFVFLVEWFDDVAQLSKDFNLSFWPKDNSVSMFDVRKKRMFLKRVTVENIELKDLFIGKSIVILSRQLHIKDYGDVKTKQFFQQNMESAIIVMYGNKCFELLSDCLIHISKSNLSIKNVRSVQFNANISPFTQLNLPIENGSVVIAVSCLGLDASKHISEWQECHSNQSLLLENDAVTNEAIFNTCKTSAVKKQCTLCLIKPHTVSEGHAGDVMATILDHSFKITAAQSFCLSPQSATEFYEVYKGVVQQYSDILEELMTGTCIALEIVAKNENEENQSAFENKRLSETNATFNVVNNFREIVGPHDATVAKVIRSSSIRAQFGHNRVKNAVHCTDLPEDGVLECEYFFKILQ